MARVVLRACWPVVLGLAGMMIVGCDPGASVVAEGRCVPGRQVSCSCPGSGSGGYRICTEEGTLGDCNCPGRGDGYATDVPDGDAGGRWTGKEECRSYEPPSDAIWVAPTPTGSDEGSGSKEDPWSVTKVSNQAEPGDLFVFKSDTYTESLDVQSGDEQAPIRYRAAERHGAVFDFGKGNPSNVDMERVEHVRFRGFRMTGTGRWFYLKDAEDIVLRDLWMEGDESTSAPPVLIVDSDYVSLLDSVATRTLESSLVEVESSRYLKFAGNAIGTSPGWAFNANGSQEMILRANVFHNAGGAPAYIGNQGRQLVEENIFTNGVDGPKKKYAAAWLLGTETIFRFNRVFRAWGEAVRTELRGERQDARHLRAYRNVFDTTVDRGPGEAEGWVLKQEYGGLRDIEIQDNVFARHGKKNGEEENGPFIRGSSWGADGPVTFRNNVFWSDEPSPVTVRVGGTDYGIERAEQSLDSVFQNNRERNPGFSDPGAFEHTPASEESPLVDGGEPLAETTEPGSDARLLPVDDVYPFYGGYKIEPDRGDRIVIGDDAELVRVVGRGANGDALKLAEERSWEKGDPVRLPFSGSAPDIGRWEHGDAGRRSVRIDQTAYVVAPNEPVGFRPDISGDLEVESLEWRLGEWRGRDSGGGARTCGTSFRHRYGRTGDYPVRLRVESRSGAVYRATAHVMVTEDGQPVDDRYNARRMREENFCSKYDTSLKYSQSNGYYCSDE